MCASFFASFFLRKKIFNVCFPVWFRESRFENYRIYYLVYEDLEAIYLVAISGKKDQQKTINTIRLFLEFFKEEIENLVRDDNLQNEKT